MSCLGLRGVYSRGFHGFLEGLRLRNGFRDLPFFRLACCALRCLAVLRLVWLDPWRVLPLLPVRSLAVGRRDAGVRVVTLLDVLELLIFWLAGRIQSKEGNKTLVFKCERYVKVSPRLSVSNLYFCEPAWPLVFFSSFAAASSSPSQQLRSVQVRQ